jgi:iron(III) transport system substrate-binding protein
MRKLMLKIALASAMAAAPLAGALAQELPDYYPDDYSKIIEGSRSEHGIVIYATLSDNNWQPIIEGFNKLYPWIKVQTLDMPSGTVHARWEAEAGSGTPSGDILVSGANDRWASYGIAGDRMLDYQSPEIGHIPDFANPYPGIYVLSSDPLVLVYNTAVLDESKRPTGMASLAEIAQANPDVFGGRITMLDASRNSFGLAAWWNYMEAKGDEGWSNLSKIGPWVRGEISGGAMNEKIVTGEYVAGIGVSGTTVFPRVDRPGGEILGYTFPDDGTIIMLRGMGIPKDTANPNSAKLFLDFVLSQAGQTAVGRGDLTPYRADVEEGSARYTYHGIAQSIGEDNVIVCGFAPGLITDASAFVEKWNAAMQGK